MAPASYPERAVARWQAFQDFGSLLGTAGESGTGQEDAHRPRVVRPALRDGVPPAREKPSPDGRWSLTELGPELALRSTSDDTVRVLSQGGGDRNEWRVDTATWSADSRSVFAVRTDHRRTALLPIVHWLPVVEEVELHPYPKTGSPIPPREYVILDIDAGGAQRPVDLGEWTDGIVTPVARPADLPELLLHAHDRYVTRCALLAVNLESGAVRTVLSEPCSIALGDHGRVAARLSALGHRLPDPRQVLWMADRDGWNHLYLRETTGGRTTRLTSGPFPVERVVAVHDDTVFVLARPDPRRPYDLHLCRVGLDGSGWRQLTETTGEHQVTAAGDGTFIDIHSSVDRPPRTERLDAGGRLLEVIGTTDVSALDRLGWRRPEEFVVTAADGTTPLHGVLYLPPDFDPARRYPIVEVIYGGSQVAVRPSTFDQTAPGTGSESLRRAGHGAQAQALAQLGFATFVLDARGTPGRGVAFHEVVRHRMGQHEIDDHAAAVAQLAADRPYLDPDRVGITGSSWGGYFALRALLTAPETFHVGVAVASVVDFDDHGVLIEKVMGSAADNRAGYDAGSNLPYAGALRGKLLIVHGTSDANATFSASMKMCDALIQAGRPFDLLVIPEGTHHPTGQRKTYLDGAVARYFVEHLRPAGLSPDDIPLVSSGV